MTACQACGFDPQAAVSEAWTFLVTRAAVSQNKLGSNRGGNRWTYAQLRADYEWSVLANVRKHGIPPATKRRRISLTRLYLPRQRAFDRGNLIGGLKPLLDVCVRQGLLVSDSPEWCLDHYSQERHPALLGVRVCLEEFADGERTE